MELKLSIGIPVYNAEQYIARCLDSILNSESMDNYEIICVDDGSTDHSLEILKHYEQLYPDILRIISSENRGAFLARSLIIDHALGEWIGFVDADDVIEAHMYDTLLQATRSNNHIDMAICAFYKIDAESGSVIGVQMNKFGDCSLDFIAHPEERGLLAAVNPAYWNKIFRKDKLKNRLLLSYSPKIMEDCLFLMSIVPFLDGVAFVSRPLYRYMDIASSVTKKIGRAELNSAKCGITDLQIYFLNNLQIKNDLLDLIAVMSVAHIGIAFTINWNDGERNIREIWQETLDFLIAKFPTWPHSRYISCKYILGRAPLRKLYLASLLYRHSVWPLIVRIYHTVCRLTGKDLKW